MVSAAHNNAMVCLYYTHHQTFSRHKHYSTCDTLRKSYEPPISCYRILERVGKSSSSTTTVCHPKTGQPSHERDMDTSWANPSSANAWVTLPTTTHQSRRISIRKDNHEERPHECLPSKSNRTRSISQPDKSNLQSDETSTSDTTLSAEQNTLPSWKLPSRYWELKKNTYIHGNILLWYK